MAKGKNPAKKTTTAPQRKQKEPFRVDTFLVDLASRFGITGTIVLVVMYTFLKYGTIAQKQEFIDKFILLKAAPGDNKYILYLVIVIVFAFLGQRMYFKRSMKIKDERIAELTRHNNNLEKRLLNR